METRVFNRSGIRAGLFPLLVLSGLLLRLYFGAPDIATLESVSERFFIPCVFHWLTEWDCPGCGITRAFIALYLWSPVVSVYYNPLAVVIGGAVVARWFALWSTRAAEMVHMTKYFIRAHAWGLLGVVVAWGVLRNLSLY